MSLVPLARLDPGPGTAREWLRSELSRAEYQRSPIQRFFDWIKDLLARAQDSAVQHSVFSPLLAVLLLVVVIGLVVFVVSRLRGNAGRADEAEALFPDVRRRAVDHRAAARAALEQRQWDECVLESVRALAADLFERGVVTEEPGATAHEITSAAARRFPDHADRLEHTVLVFDRTRYGDRPAGEPEAREALALAEDLRAATPGTTVVAGPVTALPR